MCLQIGSKDTWDRETSSGFRMKRQIPMSTFEETLKLYNNQAMKLVADNCVLWCVLLS